MPATLGQLIRERRMELGLTQEELAERVGVGVRQSEISRLERNRVTLPRRQRMEEIAQALDIPVGLLLARSGWVGAEMIDADHGEANGAGREPESRRDTESVLGERAASPDDMADMQVVEVIRDRHLDRVDGTSVADDQTHLHDAIMRAEALIAESESRAQEVHTTIMQARESVKRRQAAGS